MDHEIKIVNMVASADLGIEIDIDRLAKNADNVEYEPDQFPGAIIRYRNPGTTVLLFRNGRVVVVGNRKEEDITKTLNQLISDLKSFNAIRSKNIDLKNIKYTIPNYVAMVDLKASIDMDKLLQKASEGELEIIVEYEPDQFPGIMAWLDKYNSTALIFRNGKIIISGNKDLDTAHKSYKYIRNILRSFFVS